MFWGTQSEIAAVVREVPAGEIRLPDEPFRKKRGTGPEAESIRALADGIRARGTLEPLLTRRIQAGSSPDGETPIPGETGEGTSVLLVAGEKRLLAARLAGLSRVPCVFVDDDLREESGSGGSADGAALAIVETLRREDNGLFENASAIAALIERTGLTQEQCAARLGVSQSFVANKLRLLRLTPEERAMMSDAGLTERHGRALLRFPDPAGRMPVLRAMIEREMNVASAEEYAESLLCADARAEVRRSVSPRGVPASAADLRRLALRDTRRFTDSIDRAVDVIRRSGIPVEMGRRETPGGILISILVPKSS